MMYHLGYNQRSHAILKIEYTQLSHNISIKYLMIEFPKLCYTEFLEYNIVLIFLFVAIFFSLCTDYHPYVALEAD